MVKRHLLRPIKRIAYGCQCQSYKLRAEKFACFETQQMNEIYMQ